MEYNHIEKTHYDTLEIPLSSSGKDIQTAYLKARNTYAIDNPKLYAVFSKTEVQDLLRLIDKAYFVLSHPKRRKEYDQRILGQQKPSLPHKPSKNQNMAIQSHYKKNALFEKQIQQQDVFDGHFLQNVRTYKNITLEEIALVTRIGKPYLIAIENNEYQMLPAPVFVRGFIMQYAKCLSLDPEKVADSYMSLYKALYVV